MPQLPSGIHIAVDTYPLAELLGNWSDEGSSATLSSLKTIEDLYPLTRILELVPAQQGGAPLELLSGSLTPPQNMTKQDTGYRLSDCPGGLPSWSPEDRAAFAEFVATRVPPILQSNLELAQKHYASVTKDFLKRLEEAWMKAGVHPSQEPGWDDWPQDTNIDVFDQLIALLQCRDAIAAVGPQCAPSGNAVDRLEGFLLMAAQALPWLPKAPLPKKSVTELADAVRRTVQPSAFEVDKSDWWKTQVAIECNNLFNDSTLEPFLLANAPKGYGVIRLTAISQPDDIKV